MTDPLFPTPPPGRPTPPRPKPGSHPQPVPAPTPRPAFSALSIISLLAGAISPFLVCACYLSLLTAPVAIVTGHIADYRIRRSGGRLTGRAVALVGLILGYGSLLLTAGLFTFGAYWSGKFGNEPVADVRRQPGELALSEVERQIVSDDEGHALGNSDEARELARLFADRMKELDETLFTQTDATIKLTGGKYVTWCELRDGRCAFVVHVPEYRKFEDDAKEMLAQLAWMTAQETAAESLQPGEELAVGLKGVLLYGAVMVGEFDPDYDGEEVRVHGDKELLYPFFVDDTAPTDPAADPESTAPAAAGTPTDITREPGETDISAAPDTMPAPDHPDPLAGSPESTPADPGDNTSSAAPPEAPPDRNSPPNTPRPNSRPESVADALPLLEAEDSFLRTQAVYYFRDHPPTDSDADLRTEVVDALFAQFEIERNAAPNPFFVATALRPWVTNDDVERLDEILDHDNVLARSHTIETIGLLGTKEAAEVLAARLGDPDLRSSVSSPLRQMGEVAEGPLLEQLPKLDDDPEAVREICLILGEVGGTKSVRPLQRLAQSKNLTIKTFAQISLEKVRQRLRSAD